MFVQGSHVFAMFAAHVLRDGRGYVDDHYRIFEKIGIWMPTSFLWPYYARSYSLQQVQQKFFYLVWR